MTHQSAPILVVEDDRDLREAYAMILRSADYSVECVGNGKQALDYIETNGDPAVILLDLRMPVMDGLEFLRQFDAPNHQKTRVVLFSNYDTKKDIDAAYELGIDRYVLKARAAPKELLRLVSATLGE